MRFLRLLFAVAVLPTSAFAETYEVGPGKALSEIGDVPWEELEAGDIVKIYQRDQPYREKIVVGGTGTMANPIVVQGVPNAQGVLPIIDGEDAVTREGRFETWNEERGVVKIGGADIPTGPHEWIVIESLDIRGGAPGATFTDSLGNELEYRDNAASVFVEDAAHVTIRGCILRESANGVMVGTPSSEVLIEKNDLHGNGLEGRVNRHNAYTEGSGVTVQYNRFGPLQNGALGSAVYDTSSRFAFRYNWVEGGSIQIEMRPNEDHEADPGYANSYVYGNVLIEPNAAGEDEDVIVFWDRPGTLYFFHNTVLSRRTTTTTVFDMDPDRSIDAQNNILAVAGGGETLALLGAAGSLRLASNWLKDGYQPSHAAMFTGTIEDAGGQVGGASAGFVDEATTNVALDPNSVCRDKGSPMTGVPAEHAVSEQYLDPRGSMARPTDGSAVDLGAFEAVGPGGGGGDDVDNPPPDPDPEPPDPGVEEPMEGDKEGGCGCRSAGERGSRWPLALAFGGLALLVLRRRR